MKPHVLNCFCPEQLFLLHREQSLPTYIPTPDPPQSIMAAQPPFPISSRTYIPPTSSPISTSSTHLPSLPQRPPPHSGVVGRPPRRPPPVSRWRGGGDPGEHPWSNAASRGRGGIRERWDSLDPAMTGPLSLAAARIPRNGDASTHPPQRDCVVVEDPASGAGRGSLDSAAVQLHGSRWSRSSGIGSDPPAPLPPPHLHEAPATAAIATSSCLVRVSPPHYVNPARGHDKSAAWESCGLVSVPAVMIEAAHVKQCGSSFLPPAVGVTDLDSFGSTSPHLDYRNHTEPYPTPH
jgi:hypothetical protein